MKPKTVRIKRVDGFAKYFISSDGHVYNSWGHKLHRDMNINGYPRVVLFDDNGKRFRFLLHRLVAANYIGNIDGMDVHHKDRNRQNCAAWNLEIHGRYDHMAEYHGWEKIENYEL